MMDHLFKIERWKKRKTVLKDDEYKDEIFQGPEEPLFSSYSVAKHAKHAKHPK